MSRPILTNEDLRWQRFYADLHNMYRDDKFIVAIDELIAQHEAMGEKLFNIRRNLLWGKHKESLDEKV
jgi:hypothetical protein